MVIFAVGTGTLLSAIVSPRLLNPAGITRTIGSDVQSRSVLCVFVDKGGGFFLYCAEGGKCVVGKI